MHVRLVGRCPHSHHLHNARERLVRFMSKISVRTGEFLDVVGEGGRVVRACLGILYYYYCYYYNIVRSSMYTMYVTYNSRIGAWQAVLLRTVPSIAYKLQSTYSKYPCTRVPVARVQCRNFDGVGPASFVALRCFRSICRCANPARALFPTTQYSVFPQQCPGSALRTVPLSAFAWYSAPISSATGFAWLPGLDPNWIHSPYTLVRTYYIVFASRHAIQYLGTHLPRNVKYLPRQAVHGQQ